MNVAARPPRKRVQALAPADRRAALIAATIPLIETHGTTVTTRQIADAAGVAEGTIFGVFPDKASLIRAALIEAFRPEPVVRVIAGLHFVDDLRDRLETIVELLAAGMAQRAPLVAAMRGLIGTSGNAELGAAMLHSQKEILNALTAAIERDRDLLRLHPGAAARVLLLMIFAGNGDLLPGSEPLGSKELVSMLLDGMLVRSTTGDSPC